MSDIFDFFHGDSVNALGVLPVDLSIEQSEIWNVTDAFLGNELDWLTTDLLNQINNNPTTPPKPAANEPVTGSPVVPGG